MDTWELFVIAGGLILWLIVIYVGFFGNSLRMSKALIRSVEWIVAGTVVGFVLSVANGTNLLSMYFFAASVGVFVLFIMEYFFRRQLGRLEMQESD